MAGVSDHFSSERLLGFDPKNEDLHDCTHQEETSADEERHAETAGGVQSSTEKRAAKKTSKTKATHQTQHVSYLSNAMGTGAHIALGMVRSECCIVACECS